MKPFQRSGTVLVAVLEPIEADILLELAGEVATLLQSASSRPGDPALARLLPDGYRDDDEAAADFRRYTQGGLVERKVQNAMVLRETLSAAARATGPTPIQLDDRAAGAWMRALADMRLSLAARLGITDEESIPSDPDLADLYDWLAFVQDSLVRALEASS
jgi:hypothetical protein